MTDTRHTLSCMASMRGTCASMARPRVWAALLMLMLLSGCMAGGLGGLGGVGGYPGGQQQYPGGQQYPDRGYGASQLVGTVESLDMRNGRILLTTQTSQYRGGSRAEVYFDQRSTLYYRGQQVEISGLERGDVIRVDAAQSGGRLWARSMEVVHNVRDGRYGGGQYGNDPYGNPYGSQQGNQLQGAVSLVDPRARLIELDAGGYGGGSYGGGYGNRTRVRYDQNTRVEYRGQLYRPENLERGDLVRVQARRIGNDWLAERIWVERSVRER